MVVDKFYAFYDEKTGEVWKVSPVADDTRAHIEIDLDIGISMVDGKRNMKDYIVLPSTKNNLSFELQLKNSDYITYDVDTSIHHFKIVTEIQDDDNGLQVIHNFKKSKIEVKIGKNIKEFLKSNMYFRKQDLYMYFTKKDDPNILIDTIVVPYYELLNNDTFFIDDIKESVLQNTDMSIYCGKIFENYYYVVKNV